MLNNPIIFSYTYLYECFWQVITQANNDKVLTLSVNLLEDIRKRTQHNEYKYTIHNKSLFFLLKNSTPRSEAKIFTARCSTVNDKKQTARLHIGISCNSAVVCYIPHNIGSIHCVVCAFFFRCLIIYILSITRTYKEGSSSDIFMYV